MAEPTTLYKLVVLYMLDRIEFSMTFSQISDFILQKGYTDFFTLQASVRELVESGFVHYETVRNSSFYTITSEGEETIGYFKSKISPSIRRDIDEWLKENRMSLIDEISVSSEYYRMTDGEYTAECTVREKRRELMSLKISVPEEQQAKAICLNWKEKSQEVYAWLMQELMQ